MQISLETSIEDNRWQEALPRIEEVVETVQKAVFEYVNANEDIEILQAQYPITINLCLSDNNHVQQLNRDFRNMDKPTNVLSFANLDFSDFELQNNIYHQIELGDIIMAYETVCKEAETEQISFYAHFCHLLVHGLLHLLGYDHIETEEAEYMENLEKSILQTLDIANPYAGEN